MRGSCKQKMDEGTEEDYRDFFFETGENLNQSVWIVIEQGRVESMRALRGEVWSKVEGKGR